MELTLEAFLEVDCPARNSAGGKLELHAVINAKSTSEGRLSNLESKNQQVAPIFYLMFDSSTI